MKNIKKLTTSSLMVAIGVLTSSLLYIPLGPIKAFPVQHLINVVSVVLLGPVYAISNAFIISLIRNMMGTGTLLAFPGSIFGAILAALFFRGSGSVKLACLGEWIGTGLVGAFVATMMAKYVLGITLGASIFFMSFMTSSFMGAFIAYVIMKSIDRAKGISMNP